MIARTDPLTSGFSALLAPPAVADHEGGPLGEVDRSPLCAATGTFPRSNHLFAVKRRGRRLFEQRAESVPSLLALVPPTSGWTIGQTHTRAWPAQFELARPNGSIRSPRRDSCIGM